MTIRLKDVEVPVTAAAVPDALLAAAVAERLGLAPSDLRSLAIRKKSLDARRKARIVYHYQVDVSVDDEAAVLSRNQAHADVAPDESAADPLAGITPGRYAFRHRPVIVGSGPAGTFAALVLARAGQPCIVIERGEAVEDRLRTVNTLRRGAGFDAESNYCFGEGGAGTFSDGKLTCGRNHPLIRFLFEQWVEFGGPAEILYDAHPHIGTDYLLRIAKSMRSHLEAIGTTFLFGRRFVDLGIATDGRRRYEVALDDGTRLDTDHLILAIGHSARDTYEMLLDRGLAMQPKPFAMGARFEHPQAVIDKIQFGSCSLLPPAEYKLAAHAGERGIWTFCMCPGGHLLPTGAQPEHLAINGMSYHARNSGFANAAVVVNVLREDFYKGHPLDGMRFQAEIERLAFREGGGNYNAPGQRMADFMAGRASKGPFDSTYKPGVTPARLDRVLPQFIVDALRGAVVDYDKKMRGFIGPDALVVGVETKTSAPVVMPRDKSLQSVSHAGLFPTGEGAGFAGGIVSAALDGVRVGRAVLDEALASALAARLSPVYGGPGSAVETLS
jgi:uncharacterized FAD-dependent dehydrogenase